MYSFTVFKETIISYIVQIVLELEKEEKLPGYFTKLLKYSLKSPKRNWEIKIISQPQLWKRCHDSKENIINEARKHTHTYTQMYIYILHDQHKKYISGEHIMAKYWDFCFISLY